MTAICVWTIDANFSEASRLAFSAYGVRGNYGCGPLVVLIIGLLIVAAWRLEHLRYVEQDPLQ